MSVAGVQDKSQDVVEVLPMREKGSDLLQGGVCFAYDPAVRLSLSVSSRLCVMCLSSSCMRRLLRVRPRCGCQPPSCALCSRHAGFERTSTACFFGARATCVLV
jgi:hypothetical protein